jgi:hypothetical protein
METKKQQPSVGPKFLSILQDEMATAGEPFTFSVTLDKDDDAGGGDKVVELQWFRNNERILPSDDVQV